MKTTVSSKIGLLLGLTLFALAQPLAASAAQNFPPAFAGALLGYSTASDNLGGGFGIGVNGGYFLDNGWGAGAFLKSGNHDNGVNSFAFGAEAMYKFVGFLPGLSAGAQLGSIKFSGSNFEGDYNIAIGGKVAYDYMISGTYPISLGGELSILFSEPANEGVSLTHFLVAAKFWFG